jgi:hypothetical protein
MQVSLPQGRRNRRRHIGFLFFFSGTIIARKQQGHYQTRGVFSCIVLNEYYNFQAAMAAFVQR